MTMAEVCLLWTVATFALVGVSGLVWTALAAAVSVRRNVDEKPKGRNLR